MLKVVAVSVDMGVEMGRPGRVEARLGVGEGGGVRRVSVLGRATRTLTGVLELSKRTDRLQGADVPL